jgi:hypothetical protein
VQILLQLVKTGRVVNSEPTWCSMRRSEGRSDSHGRQSSYSIQLLMECGGVFEGQSAEVNIVKKNGRFEIIKD